MHLLIPFASTVSAPAAHVLRDLVLPNLSRLLGRLTPTTRDAGDEYSLSPPHERALAAAWSWPVVDGRLPFAARAAAEAGLEIGTLAWGRVTPTHWHVARDHVSLADPAALELSAEESRAAFDAVRELFESEGIRLEWTDTGHWFAAHPSFAGVACASLDRVIGRNVELWMRPGADPETRLIRRLQSEVQLLLYPHPLNEAREAAGRLTVNSFWLSGCGRALPATAVPVEVAEQLRTPLLADDWAGWAEAWARLDRDVLPRLLDAASDDLPVMLTLCGERSAQRFEARPRSLWQKLGQRWSAADAGAWLEAL